MLVLSRKLYEEIVIGNDIRVRVVAIEHGKVRLGIVAPTDVRVDREEVRRAREAANEEKGGGKWPALPVVT